MLKNRYKAGFTLVEVMVVITILAILVSIIVLNFKAAQTESEDEARRVTAMTIMDAVERYYQKNGDYPYGNDVNPSFESDKMTSYQAVADLMPWLDASILDSNGYNFYAYSCPTSACSSSPSDSENRITQYIYRAANYSGAANSYLRHSLWGCQIMIPDDASSPGAVLFWKEKSTGKWIFKRTKHGTVSISNYGSGPTPPTVCAFS